MTKEVESEYLVKLAALDEFEKGLKFRKTYEELVHVFLGLTKEITRYREKNAIPIPESEVYARIVAKAQATIMSRVSSDESLRRKKSDGDLDSTLLRNC